jgi:hypothetical protein
LFQVSESCNRSLNYVYIAMPAIKFRILHPWLLLQTALTLTQASLKE